MKLIRSIYDVILDRSPEEILGAFAIAVALSIALSGVFALLRRKVEDRVLLVIVLTIVACTASMGLGAGYVTTPKNRSPRPGPGGNEGYPGRMGYRVALSPRALRKADVDGDGRISTAEASEAAASYVGELDAEHGMSVDFATLAEAIARSGEGPMMSPPMFAEPAPELDAKVAEWLVSSADADGNRRLTVEEASAFLRAGDVDGDGGLSHRELRRLMQALSPAQDPPGGRRGRPSQGPPTAGFEIPIESPARREPPPTGPAGPDGKPGPEALPGPGHTAGL